MPVKRTTRLNSLLKEVIAEVIRNDLHHPPFDALLVTVTHVDIAPNLSNAKVYLSILAPDKAKVLGAIRGLARRIAVMASRKVVMRIFPVLDFVIDEELAEQLHMQDVLTKISDERTHREQS